MPFHILEMRGGGAEVQAWLLAKELARRGFDVHYVAMSVRGKAGTTERLDGVTIRWLPYREHLRWRNSLRWYAALRDIDPDLVIQRMTSEATGVIGLYARRHGKAFSWICTGDAIPRRWLHLRRQVEANRAKAPGAVKSLVFLADAALADVMRQIGMRCLTHAFTQNETQRRDLKAVFGLDSHRLPSGHEPPAAPTDAEARRRGAIVLWAGTLGAQKRPELFGELARRFEGAPVRFVVAGGHADEAYRAGVVSGFPSNVEWLGQIAFEESLSWFDRASVLVNTSDREGFPNTFIQAWLRGVPVLTLGVDPDGIVRGNGLGAVASTVDGMASELRAMLGDPAGYARLAARVAAFARERYTVERVADVFLDAVGAPQAATLTA
ncbi:MAG TPA: glycosyltransferase family 4 protein [Planctomycetota bacterium]|nr:glycosyltransferase family 4 protein [Planctomycetota bacterium]